MVNLPRSVHSINAIFLSCTSKETAFTLKVVLVVMPIFYLSLHPHT